MDQNDRCLLKVEVGKCCIRETESLGIHTYRQRSLRNKYNTVAKDGDKLVRCIVSNPYRTSYQRLDFPVELSICSRHIVSQIQKIVRERLFSIVDFVYSRCEKVFTPSGVELDDVEIVFQFPNWFGNGKGNS